MRFRVMDRAAAVRIGVVFLVLGAGAIAADLLMIAMPGKTPGVGLHSPRGSPT